MIASLTKTGTPRDKVAGSFRDPSGFLFHGDDNVLYRQVNQSYKVHYDKLMGSPLYKKLQDENLLVPHEEVSTAAPEPEFAYKVIRPERVPFISYPYEWSFSQLKDAALATLAIQKEALQHGLTLKDASAYNIQFVNAKPVLIDTLSFETYVEGKPWVAYRQFCQHFLAPLALMALVDVRLSQLLRSYIDGVPLDLASNLLPWKTRLNFGLLTHIHLHAGKQQEFSDKPIEMATTGKVSKLGLLGTIDNLEGTIKGLEWKPAGTEWGDYYNNTNYTSDAFTAKKDLVYKLIADCNPKTLWDLGGNTGEFTRLGSGQGVFSIAFDIDPAAVEKNYRQCKAQKDENLLPLVLDLTNPSPGLGWAHSERDAFAQRGPADVIMALAIIHHISISNNVPLERVAEFFAQLGKNLIIEFVPKNDSQVKLLLATREDVFPNYTQKGFEEAFQHYFHIEHSHPVPGSERTLYLMQRQ